MKAWRIVTVTALGLVLCLVPTNLRECEQRVHYSRFPRDISSTILLNRSMYSSRGKGIGFHYAMMQLFEGHSGNVIAIRPPLPGACYWDSLADGRIDIVVADTVPAKYADEFIASETIHGRDRWYVRKDDRMLFNAINGWIGEFSGSNQYNRLVGNYYRNFQEPWRDTSVRVSQLSPYDALIRKYSNYIGWDWRLVTAVVFEESRFSMGAQSNRNAIGLMQIKESTARYYGIEDIYNPEMNVKAGVLHLQRLCRMYKAMEMDPENVIKFTLGAYNAGEGRIDICMKTTAEHGHDQYDWDEVTGCFQYVPDFIGDQTRAYVNRIMDRYERYRHIIALNPGESVNAEQVPEGQARDSVRRRDMEALPAIRPSLSVQDSLRL